MILKNRLVGILSVLLIVGFGLACSGGGGSNGSVLPTLPDGKLYFSQNGWVQIIPSFPYQALAEYLPADTAQLDASTALTIPNDYGAPFWAEGYEFWGGAYGEDGFIMAVEPDNPSESIARLSVALHNYGINLLPEATAFIQADPAHNLFPVIEIMNALSGSGGGISTNGRYVNFTITAGGEYQRVVKPEALATVDSIYDGLLAQYPILFFYMSRTEFRGYMSGLIYNSAYTGGEQVSLSALLELIASPLNWNGLAFEVTARLGETVIPTINSAGIVASTGTYTKINLFPDNKNRPYGNKSSTRFFTIPEEYRGFDYIRTDTSGNVSADPNLLSFNIYRDATIYVGLDSTMDGAALAPWLSAGWDRTSTDSIVISNYPTTGLYRTLNIYDKDFPEGTVTLPGLNNSAYAMYTVIARADSVYPAGGKMGTFTSGINVIVSAHTALMEDDPADVVSFSPGTRNEGGIVATSVELVGSDTVVHANFVKQFDANRFLDTETGQDTALTAVTGLKFADAILRNDGFRLIDTYNDQGGAFGYGDQILHIDNMLDFAVGLEVPLTQANLYTFTNMDLLNSPNLCGVCLESISTDSTLQLWENIAGNNKLRYTQIYNAIKNLPAENFTYFYDDPAEPITVVDLLKRLGKTAEESKLTFGVRILLADNVSYLHLRAGLFVTDYFTDVYEAAIGDAIIIPTAR